MDGGGSGKLLFNGYRVSVLQDERSSVIGCGDGCKRMQMYLIPLNCIVKNG